MGIFLQTQRAHLHCLESGRYRDVVEQVRYTAVARSRVGHNA